MIDAQRPLKDVVGQISFELKLEKEAWHWLFQSTINCVRELNMFKLKEAGKVIKATVDTTINAIEMPSDCLKVLGVAIANNGRIWTLTRDDTLIPTTTTVNSQETLDNAYQEGFAPNDESLYRPGDFGGRNEAYYVVDEPNRRVLIRGKSVSSVFLIYISSGIEVSATTYIPMKCYQAIKTYCAWKWHESEWEAMNKIAYYEDQYYIELNKLEQFEAPSFQELYDAFLKTLTPSIKR